MGDVVNISSKRNGYVRYLHKTGWEKGCKVKCKWNGFYEHLGILPNSNITCYGRGNFDMGLKVGRWEITYLDINKHNSIQVHTGRYDKGKRHGLWIIAQFGKVIEERSYEKGKLIKNEIILKALVKKDDEREKE